MSGEPGQTFSSSEHRFYGVPLCGTTIFLKVLQTTHLSGSSSTMEAAGEKGKGGDLGEGGVTAGLELGVLGD
jgi:hypothetical protein